MTVCPDFSDTPSSGRLFPRGISRARDRLNPPAWPANSIRRAIAPDSAASVTLRQQRPGDFCVREIFCCKLADEVRALRDGRGEKREFVMKEDLHSDRQSWRSVRRGRKG